MARELSDKDREILRKLVPEFDELISQGIDLGVYEHPAPCCKPPLKG